MDANRGEHEKFEKLTRKFGDLKAAFPYLVEYFGKVQTDLGEGLVFQAIKDFDGSMSKTIESAGEIGGYNKPILLEACLLYTSPSPRDGLLSRMPSSA